MTILTLIPARGGSKGLVGKNIKYLAGKPLIAWTIEHAKASKYIDDIIVSTDDNTIALVAERYGASVPFLRPRRLAQDDTSTVDVVLHFLDYLKKDKECLPDVVVLLQPTSPLRSSDDIDRALEMLVANRNANAVVGITEVLENPYWMKTMKKEGYMVDFIPSSKGFHRRQDLPIVYKLNGAIFICKTSALLKSKTFFPKKTLGYIMPRENSIDIDDIIDFKIAESIITNRKNSKVKA